MLVVVFGLPGHGKTTYLAKLANDYYKSKNHGFIYSNVPFKLPGVVSIDPQTDIGRRELFSGIIIIDESSQEFDSRDFKHFSKEKIKFFNEHRHHFISKIYCSVQKYDALDVKLRNIAERCIWIRAYFPHSPFSLTRAWNIPRSVLIANSADASKLSGGEIVQGYTKPDLFSRLFCTRFFGRKYWKYFDSFKVDVLSPLEPEHFQTEDDYKDYIRKYQEHAAAAELRNKKIQEEIEKLRSDKKPGAGSARQQGESRRKA